MIKEIEESQLSDLGKLQAYRLWNSRPLQTEVAVMIPTDDLGMTVEFDYRGSELLYAIPRSGEVVYYTATRKDFRRSGVIPSSSLSMAVCDSLGKWLIGCDFPL